MSEQHVLSVEVCVSMYGVALSVEHNCGLKQADSLAVSIRRQAIEVRQAGSVLPLDFPSLSAAHCAALVAVKNVPVGEFLAYGLKDAYQLRVIEID